MLDEKLILCFNPEGDQGTLYYKISLDNGETWSETSRKIARNGNYRFSDHTIISASPNVLMCVFKLQRNLTSPYNIYVIYSSDSGESWGDTINLSGYEKNEIIPRISKDNNNTLLLAYLRTDTIYCSTRYSWDRYKIIQNDIYYRKSTDNGLSWISEEKFTKYLGDDNFINLSSSGELPFVSFSSGRFNNYYQIAFGVPGFSQDNFTPPLIINTLVTEYSPETKKTTINASVLDDEGFSGVYALLFDSSIVELFDDGLHDDVEEGDFIFGNEVFVPIPSFQESILMNVNKILLPLDNKGIVADVDVQVEIAKYILAQDNRANTTMSNSKLSVHYFNGRQYDEGNFLFSGGFMLSGFSNGELWANGVASASRIGDYLPGNSGGNIDDPLNVIYTVYASDPPFGYSWQRWKDAVNLGADFYDGDGDGIYNPVDKNWNGIWDPGEDMPDLLGKQTAWCVFSDSKPDSLRRFKDVKPQGIEIHQTLFATNEQGLDEVIFVRYKIINRGNLAGILDSVFFSFWSDPDLGDHTDDLVGTDTLLSSGFIYNDGYDELYGSNAPSFFNTLLQGPASVTGNSTDTSLNNRGVLMGIEKFPGQKNLSLTSTRHYQSSDPVLGDPAFKTEARNYMLGLLKNGTQINPCFWYLGEVRGGVNCNLVNPLFVYSGDPASNIGWINTVSTDQRLMINVGPFVLEKDKPVTIIGAYVLGRGTDPINSITVARENVQRAIQEYLSNFASLTYNPGEPTNPVVNYILHQNYPNPFNPITTIRYELPQDGVVTIELFNILGQKVKTILNEFKKADRYEITLNATGLASGVYIYQLKVNDFITSKKMVVVR